MDSISSIVHLPFPPDGITYDCREREPVEISPDYRLYEVLSSDLAYEFVQGCFDKSPVEGKGIKSVRLIVNEATHENFNKYLTTFKRVTQEDTPTLPEPFELRKKVLQKWEEETKNFSRVHIESKEGAKTLFPDIKILPLWHGTNADNSSSICRKGFEKGLTTTDKGFFGDGFYFTDSPCYAKDFGNTLVLSAVAIGGLPFPVVNDKSPGEKPSDMEKLAGTAGIKGYSASYIPVTVLKQENANSSIFYPCSEKDKPAFNEYVIYEKSQILPLFIIDLVENKTLTNKDKKKLVKNLLNEKDFLTEFNLEELEKEDSLITDLDHVLDEKEIESYNIWELKLEGILREKRQKERCAHYLKEIFTDD